VADTSRRPALLAFLRTLSPQTPYRRFVTPAPPTGVVDLDVMLATDACHRAVVALDGDEVVGHAMAITSADGGEVELAVVVADDRQGQGIGRRLVRALLDAEPVASARELEFLVLAWNAPARQLIARLWPDAHATREGELIHYRAPTGVATAAVGGDAS
jgi:GNAT superfamily N-acetyltransferase